MSRQRSLFAFFRKSDGEEDQGHALGSPAQEASSAGNQAQMDEGRQVLIDKIAQKMKKPAGRKVEAPFVPGTKRVRDDCPGVALSGDRNKRMRDDFMSPGIFIDGNKREKLLEALGDDEDLKQGAWAEAQAKFEWMYPLKIRDGKGRKSTDPLFDKRTLQIPADVLRKMSASQRQYWATKCQYMDVVLFFKVGKFYELYELDAEIGRKELDWKMTISGVGRCRQVGVPESGIEDAVQKLVARGYKVGRMEQTETAEQAKAIRGPNAMVDRKLVQVLTPSTLTEGITRPEAIHLMALKEVESGCVSKTVVYGFAFADVAAGRCYLGSFCDNDLYSALNALLMQVAPQELLYELGGLSEGSLKVLQRYSRPGFLPMALTPLQPDLDFIEPVAVLQLIKSRGYFQDFVRPDDNRGPWPKLFADVEHKYVAATALGGLVSHLCRIKMDAELPNGVLCVYEVYKGSMRLDGQTITNLELLENTANGSEAGSLIGYLDSCATSFGKRLLRRWICHPLQDIEAINHRLDAVEEILSDIETASVLRGELRRLPDLERLIARIRGFSDGSCSELPVPLAKQAFRRRLKTLCLAVQGLQHAFSVLECLRQMPAMTYLLRAACELLNAKSSIDFLHGVERHLDVGTLLFHMQNDEDDQRKTLSWLLLEFNEHKTHWAAVVDAISYIDVLQSFAAAKLAADGPTCRPTFVTVNPAVLEMRGLWHPFAAAGMGGTYVPNDVRLGSNNPRAMLLTGPNMGGKSTLLRATCLAALMAHLGCFIPSESCTLSPVDTIFTRIGARDRIMSGESTFMVECAEAGSILHHATCRSLVVLDELGRGTSTFDGYAIAYAVFRHLVEERDCRLLFATHYHPLTEEFSGNPFVSLKHMACTFDQASGKQLVFLYKLQGGPCPRSYGLQVALLAGVPASVVEAAKSARGRLQTVSCSQQERWLQKIRDALGEEDAHKSLLALWDELRKLRSNTLGY